MKYFFIFMTLLFIGATISYGTNQLGPDSLCFGCHNEVYDKARSVEFRHSVVFEKCPICHIKNYEKNMGTQNAPHAPGFLDERAATIFVCLKCHRVVGSHPVDIKANKKSVKNPTNLPTLQGGIITCVTCHEGHGSDSKYFTRAEFKRELCLECHIEDMLSKKSADRIS